MVLNLKIVPKSNCTSFGDDQKFKKKITKISCTGSEPEIINFLYVDLGEVNWITTSFGFDVRGFGLVDLY